MPESVFIDVDAERLADLAKRFDTSAETREAARAAAVEMAKRTGMPCHVLGITDTVEPQMQVRWTT